MNSCAVSASTPMSRRAILICPAPLAQPDTALTPRHRAQQPRWPITNSEYGHTRRPGRPMRSGRLTEGEEPQQPFPRSPRTNDSTTTRWPFLDADRRVLSRSTHCGVRAGASTHPLPRQREKRCFRGLMP
jgi:hypothetical protein